MKLNEYPRPAGDTGIGFNFCTDESQYRDDEIRFWIDELVQLGASWLVLPSTLEQAVPSAFLRELIAHDIEPVIRIVIRPIRAIDPSAFSELCREYASQGVHYLHVYQEPNLATEWTAADWCLPGLPRRFSDLLVPALGQIAEAGLFPLVSPLAPGGHYWDLTFLEQLLKDVAKQAPGTVVDRLGICVHNYASNLPLEWGQGGPRCWPLARPYTTPPEYEDHQGFRLYEWYDAIVRRRLGDSFPLIAGETGLVPGTQNHAGFPPIGDALHAERSAKIARMALDDELPEYLFNVAFWTLNAGKSDPVDYHAWYKRDGTRLPTVDALKALPKHPRQAPEPTVTFEKVVPFDVTVDVPAYLLDPVDVGEELEIPAAGSDRRTIDHYVLFLSFSERSTGDWSPRHMIAGALEYLAVFEPTVGFRLAEAQQARRVTVIGDDTVKLVEIEEELRQSGCLVERIDASNERDVHEALGELVRRQKRFFHLPE